MAPETMDIVVENVEGPNGNGWFEIMLDEDSPNFASKKLSTKNELLAKAAFTVRGTVQEARVSATKSGKFENFYLNEINGVKDAPPARPRTSRTSTPSIPAPKDNERIARQWAYGRATELLIGSGMDFAFPLDDTTISHLDSTAQMLLDKSR